MIDQPTMIATLSDDLRGRLRGDLENQDLIKLCARYIELTGNCCPTRAMERAVVAWADSGLGDIIYDSPTCSMCGKPVEELHEQPEHGNNTELNVVEVRKPDGWYCESCDVTYGASWGADPEKRLELFGCGRPEGM